ncbi:hypothetical protein C5P21_22190, partial [Escherichia coli]
VLPENPASYRVVRTKSYLFNKATQAKKNRRNGRFPLLLKLSDELITSQPVDQCRIQHRSDNRS